MRKLIEGELVYHTLIGCSRHKRSFRFGVEKLLWEKELDQSTLMNTISLGIEAKFLVSSSVEVLCQPSLGGCYKRKWREHNFLLPDEWIFEDENFSCWRECKIPENGILEVIVV